MDFLNEAQKNYEQDINVLQTIQTDTTQPTGFVDRTSSMLMISTRDFSVTPTSTTFDIYSAGQKYSKEASTTTIADTKGLHYIYFDSSGDIQNSMNMWDLESANVPIASVFWNGTVGVIHEERHGCKRNLSWHKWAHDTVGTRYETGLVGTMSTSATSFTGGTVHDEDLEVTIGAQSGNCVRIWYHDTGAATMIFDATTVATTAKIVAGVLKYDNGGTLTTVTNNNYITNWVYASNEIEYPIYCITAQAEGTLANARAVGLPNMANMPSAELKLLYKVIWRNVGGTPTYIEKSDFRMSATLPAGGTASTNASSVIFTPYGNIASTNVQTALQELDDEKQVNLVSGTNVTVSGSSINTIQDITTSSTPTFDTTILSGLTASKAVVTDADKKLTSSAVSSTELGYLSGSNRSMQAGIDWTIQSTTPVEGNWYSVCYGNGLYVAVADSAVMTSSDGVQWTSRTPAKNNVWNSVCYGNGLYVAVSSTGTGDYVMTSIDGITWTTRTSAANNNWQNVCYANGLFVACASSGSSNRIMTSPDGIVWTSRTTEDRPFNTVCYGNGLFVICVDGASSYTFATSTDGITWIPRNIVTTGGIRGLCYGNGVFVAVGNTGEALTSTDGITWTSRTPATATAWQYVCYGDGLFVAVAASGTNTRVMTSPDGITWTTRTSAADNTWRAICYGNGMFVAVSSTGTFDRVMTSGKTKITETSLNNITHGTQTFTGELTGNAVTRMSGYAFNKELYYSTNTLLVDDCETIWTNNSVTGEAGTAALDSTNFKVGLTGSQCTTSVANGGIRVSKTLDFTKFNDGSTSTTDDYICFAFYITTENKDLLGTYGVSLIICSDVPSSVNFYYTQVTKANTVVGWNYIKVAKKDFNSYGSPNWASIVCYGVSVGSSPSGAVTFTVDAIRMVRKDPSSAVQNPFQRNVNGTWTRDFQIVAGEWFVGVEFGEVICRVFNLPDALSLLGTVPYSTNAITYDKIKTKYAGAALGQKYYVGANDWVAIGVSTNVLYLSIRQTGQSNITPQLNLTAALNDVFEFYLTKNGIYFSAVVYKNCDYNTPYALSGSLTGGDYTQNGYIGTNSYKENIEALAITTTENANHANVADTSKNVINKWLSWTPTVTWTTGTPEGSVAQTARYTTIGNICYINYSYTATDGNGATALTITLPVTAKDNNALFSLSSQQKQNTTWSNPLCYIDDDSDGIAFRSLSTCTDAQAVEIIVSGFYEI